MDSSIANWQARLGKYRDAHAHYTRAMTSAEEKRQLPHLVLARSKVLTKLAKHEEARADAETVLKALPKDMNAIENDASTLYQQDDFEEALVRFYQGLSRRQKPDYFYTGIKVADETIQTCIGRKSGFMMKHKILGNTIIDMELKDFNRQLSEIDRARKKRDFERRDRYFSERYLRGLAKYKTFFQQCLNNPDINSSNEEHNEQLNNILKDALEVIERQKESLMTRCPVYVLKQQEPKMSERMLNVREEETLVSRRGARQVILKLVKEAESAEANQHVGECFHYAVRALRCIASQPNRLFDEKAKNRMKARVYVILGKLFLDMKVLTPGLTMSDNEQRILYMLGRDVKEKRLLALVKDTVRPVIFDLKKFKRDIESQLEVSVEPLERIYLHHELSWALQLSGQHELARKAAVFGYRAAKRIRNDVWCINNAFLVARAEINQSYLDESKNAINEAIGKAKNLGNENCVLFFEKILELTDNSELMDADGLSKEEKKMEEIINLMPTQELRLEASNMLHKMANLPEIEKMSSSRESTVSRFPERDSRKTMKLKARAKRQTVMESGSLVRYKSVVARSKSIFGASLD